MSQGDPELIDAIGEHLDRHVGTSNMVIDEIRSPHVHLDIHVVPPGPDRDFLTLCTSGCAERPMTLPSDMDPEWSHAEVCCLLPSYWQIDNESLKEERWWFPFRLLKTIARLPHEHGSWIGYGHTLTSGSEGEPEGFGRFHGLILMSPEAFEPDFFTLRLPQRLVHIWQMVPLLPEELGFKVKHGAEELFEFIRAFANDYGFQAMFDLERPSVLT